MNNTSLFDSYESSVRSYCRMFPSVFSSAKGSLMFDEKGSAYIDFFCGAGALNFGHNNEYIKDAVIEYMKSDGIIHGLDMYTCAKRNFIDTFVNRILLPRNLNYKIMFCGPTGTNAIEASLKLARKYTGRTKVWAFMGGFHGMTLGALSLTTEKSARDCAGVELSNCTHIPSPYMFPNLDVIAYMQCLLDDDHSGIDKPAALIMETVQAEGGVYPFSNDFIKACRDFCTQNDILFIIDDIQVGCARTGSFFSFERANIQPDMVVLSKSIGGMGMPMSLVLISPEKDVWNPAEHNGTFRGNQLGFVAGTAALEYLLNENLEEECRRKAKIIESYIANEILPLDNRLSTRGIGMIWGVDCSNLGGETFSKLICDICFEHKLIVERVGRNNTVIKIMPALVIEDDILLRGLSILKKSIQNALITN